MYTVVVVTSRRGTIRTEFATLEEAEELHACYADSDEDDVDPYESEDACWIEKDGVIIVA